MHLSTIFLVLIDHQQSPVHAVRRVIRSAVFHICGRVLHCQYRNKTFHRHRLCKIIALSVVTPVVLKPLQLFPGLYTLRHHSQFHPTGQVHDKAQDALAGGSRNLCLNKLHIQLQHIDGHFRKHIQRRVTASKIIHFNDETQPAQSAQGLDELP